MPLRKTYILFSISLAIALFFVALFIFFFQQIKLKNEVASTLSQTIDEKTVQQKNISLLQKVIDDTKQKRTTLRSYIVDENSADTFIGWVEDQGTAIGIPITITSVVISPSKVNTLSIGLTGTSNFANVMRFVSLIEYSPYQIHITKVNFNKILNASSANLIPTNTNVVAPVKDSSWQFDMGFDVVSNKFNTKI